MDWNLVAKDVFASSSSDGTVKLWQPGARQSSRTFRDHGQQHPVYGEKGLGGHNLKQAQGQRRCCCYHVKGRTCGSALLPRYGRVEGMHSQNGSTRTPHPESRACR